MANENQASYAKIGLTVVLGAIATAITLVYFGGIGDKGHELYAETYYTKPVSGLSIGSEVNFRGVKVGEVRDISFIGCQYDDVAEEDMQLVYILIAFNTRLFRLEDWESPSETLAFMIEKGIRATVTSGGITGMSRIELNFPRMEMAPARISWKPEYPCIPPAPSILDNFSDSATKIMNQINHMDFEGTWRKLAGVADSVTQLSQNANGILEDQRARIAQILANLEDASGAIRDLALELKADPSLLIRPATPENLPETAR